MNAMKRHLLEEAAIKEREILTWLDSVDAVTKIHDDDAGVFYGPAVVNIRCGLQQLKLAMERL